jgi:hypothetical protein
MKRIALLLFMLIKMSMSAQYVTINVAQDTIVVYQGEAAIFNISAIPDSGFSASLFLSAIIQPCHLSLIFSPTVLNAPYTNSDLIINNTASIRPDTFDVIIKAENGPYSVYDTSVLVIQTSDSIKWACFNTGNSGLFQNRILTVRQSKESNDIWVLQDNHMGSSWLSRFNGYSWETMDNDHYHSITDMCGNISWDANDSPIEDNNYITAFYIDSSQIWLGMSGGVVQSVNRFDLSLEVDTALVNTRFRQITKDYNGNIWGAGDNGLLWKYDGVLWTNYNSGNSPLSAEVYSVVIDKNNRLLIGTHGNGLVIYDGTFWTVFNTTNSVIPTNWVDKIVLGHNDLPIIYNDNIIYSFDGISCEIIGSPGSVTGLEGIGFLQVDSSSIWYAGGNFGSNLKSFDGTTTTIIEALNMGVPVIDFTTTTINDMMKDSLGNIWISTDNGLVVYNKNGLSDLFDSPRELYTPNLVSIHETEISEADFIYPNPSDGIFTIRMTHEKSEQLNCRIIDAKGNVIKNMEYTCVAGYREYSFDISQYGYGLYYITVSSLSFRRSQKLVIVK